MLAGIIDHLWQSIAFAAIVFVVAHLTRWNTAVGCDSKRDSA